MDILYDYYLPSVISAMIFVLSTIAYVVPYASRLKQNNLPLPVSNKSHKSHKSNKPVQYNSTVTNNFWHPLIWFLCISLFLYSVVIIRKLNNSSIVLKPGSIYQLLGYVIFWGLLSLIAGFIIMLNYVELACNMLEFTFIMSLLSLMSIAHWVFNEYSISKYYIIITVCIIITLNILMWLLTDKFYYYIK